MPDWSVAELLESTAYGILWAISRNDGRYLYAHRVRKRKGQLYCEHEAKKFYAMSGVERTHILFVDKAGKVHHLFPNGTLQESLELAFKKGKV